MTIIALGINHNTAPVELRERVAFAPELLVNALQQLTVDLKLNDTVILSTCNRTEIYCSGKRANTEEILSWLSRFHQVSLSQLAPYVYDYQDLDACKHLMRVASGLDSLVLGEPQILGQIKQAYSQSKNTDAISSDFERLFQHTFSVAKQVRTETEIGANAVSVAYAAVNLAKHIFGQLNDAKVLLIGAGETIELVARHLVEQRVNQMTVANRTRSRAQALADTFDGQVISLAQVPEKLAEADIVISSTASTLPIIGKGVVEAALKKRRYNPIFLVDLAVPRDIEGQVSEIEDAYLYTVDDLQMIVGDNIAIRTQAAKEAETIVCQQAEAFSEVLRSLSSVDIIRQYRANCDEIKQELLAKAKIQYANGKEPEKILEEMAYKLTNRLMHSPTNALKTAAKNGESEQLDLIKNVLGI
ncbi:MAG: glutamyl-tRNA reductase [Phenylobacterium sp.]|jgi:glutamyl-tRNA reductase